MHRSSTVYKPKQLTNNNRIDVKRTTPTKWVHFFTGGSFNIDLDWYFGYSQHLKGHNDGFVD